MLERVRCRASESEKWGGKEDDKSQRGDCQECLKRADKKSAKRALKTERNRALLATTSRRSSSVLQSETKTAPTNAIRDLRIEKLGISPHHHLLVPIRYGVFSTDFSVIMGRPGDPRSEA